MALKTRRDLLPFETGIDTTMLSRASKLVSNVTAFPVQYNKAIVGKNAFATKSGIHQDGMLKNAETYEIMTPENVGVKETSLVMGKHSGRHAFRDKLTDLGYELGDDAFEDAFRRFKDLADRKKHVFDEDIVALVDDEYRAGARPHQGDLARPSSPAPAARSRRRMTLDIDGAQHTAQSTGNGPVDATFNAIKVIVPHEAKLALYPGPRRDRGHRRTGGGVGAAGGGAGIGHRPRRRHRYDGRRLPRPTSPRSTS